MVTRIALRFVAKMNVLDILIYFLYWLRRRLNLNTFGGNVLLFTEFFRFDGTDALYFILPFKDNDLSSGWVVASDIGIFDIREKRSSVSLPNFYFFWPNASAQGRDYINCLIFGTYFETEYSVNVFVGNDSKRFRYKIRKIPP